MATVPYEDRKRPYEDRKREDYKKAGHPPQPEEIMNDSGMDDEAKMKELVKWREMLQGKAIDEENGSTAGELADNENAIRMQQIDKAIRQLNKQAGAPGDRAPGSLNQGN